MSVFKRYNLGSIKRFLSFKRIKILKTEKEIFEKN